MDSDSSCNFGELIQCCHIHTRSRFVVSHANTANHEAVRLERNLGIETSKWPARNIGSVFETIDLREIVDDIAVLICGDVLGRDIETRKSSCQHVFGSKFLGQVEKWKLDVSGITKSRETSSSIKQSQAPIILTCRPPR